MEEEISLVEIGQTLIKRWKLLVFLPILAAAIAFLVSTYFFTPEYESQATLIVLPITERTIDGDVVRHDVSSTRQVVQSTRELTLAHDSMQQIVGELNLPYGPGELRSRVEIDVGDVTTIRVTDTNPHRAQLIADHITDVLMEYIIDFARLENVQLLNPAQLPTSSVNDRTTLNMAVAFVLALMISVALAFLFEHLDNTIKTSEDVQKYLSVPVLGVIPEFEEEERR